MQMSIIDYLLVFALLTTALYALYAILFRWPYPHPDDRGTRKSTQANAEGRSSPTAKSMRQDAALHAFSR